MTVYEKIKRKQALKGHVDPVGKLGVLLVLAILLSPFVVAFWIMGISTPHDAKDWVVLTFYVVLLFVTISFLLLYAYALVKRKICKQRSG